MRMYMLHIAFTFRYSANMALLVSSSFSALWFLAWRNAGRLRKEGRKEPQTQWLSDLGAMCQVSLVGYAVGGAFLSLAYFDLPYNILVMIVLGRRWIKRRAWLEPEELHSAQPQTNAVPA